MKTSTKVSWVFAYLLIMFFTFMVVVLFWKLTDKVNECVIAVQDLDKMVVVSTNDGVCLLTQKDINKINSNYQINKLYE